MEEKEHRLTVRLPERLWWQLAEAAPKLRLRGVNAVIVRWLEEKAAEFAEQEKKD